MLRHALVNPSELPEPLDAARPQGRVSLRSAGSDNNNPRHHAAVGTEHEVVAALYAVQDIIPRRESFEGLMRCCRKN